MISYLKPENTINHALPRIWQLDFIRGIAIILMVIFHIIVDLVMFWGWDIEYLSGFWYYWGKTSAILFILASGLSSTLSRNNHMRGLKLLGWALVITVCTYIYIPSMYVQFGILHLLGTCSLSYFFVANQSPSMLIAASLIFFIAGNYFTSVTVAMPYLFPLGLITPSFASVDYYPLFPWYGVYLLGLAVAKIISVVKLNLNSINQSNLAIITHLGRNSLLIYLIHQPILLLLLSFMTGIIAK